MGPYPVSSKKLTRTTEWDGAKDLLFTVFAYFILPSPFESNAAELSSSTSFISFQKGHMKTSFSVRSRPRSVTDDCTDLRVPRLVPEPGRSVRWIVARIRLFFKMRIPLGFPSATTMPQTATMAAACGSASKTEHRKGSTVVDFNVVRNVVGRNESQIIHIGADSGRSMS